MASESDNNLRRSGRRSGPDHGTDQYGDPVRDSGHDGHPKGRSRLTIAVVAGAVLLAGGGGAYWAASAADDSAGAAAHGNPPTLALSGWTGGGTGVGGLPGARIKVTADLPSGPASAPVYQPAGQATRAQVARLAAALKVTGTPADSGSGWKVAPAKGAGPTLQVGPDAPYAWSYVRAGSSCAPHGDTAPGARICYGAASGPATSGTPVSAAAAQRAVAPALSALGLSGAATDASTTAGADRTVTADPVVGGLPTTGWQTTFQVGPDGSVVSGAGRLVPLAKGAVYPVVGAQRALDELRRPGNTNAPAPRLCGGGGVMHPGAASGRGGNATTDTGQTGTAAGTAPGSGPCIAATPPVTVDSARFGLSAQYVNGRPELVPSWLFTTAPASGPAASGGTAGGELAQPAVDPKFVTAPRTPTAPTGPTNSIAHVTSYTAAGRTVTLRFWGGLCADYSGKVTSQSGDAVRVRIDSVVKDPAKKCPLLAKSVTVKVTLAQPLGDRKVYDATDGRLVRH